MATGCAFAAVRPDVEIGYRGGGVQMKKITVRKAGSVRLTSAAQPLYGGCVAV